MHDIEFESLLDAQTALRAPEAADAQAVAWQARSVSPGGALGDWFSVTKRHFDEVVTGQSRGLYSGTEVRWLKVGSAAPPAASADAVISLGVAVNAKALAKKLQKMISQMENSGDWRLSEYEARSITVAAGFLAGLALSAPVAGADAGMRERTGDELGATSYEGREVTLRHDTIINGIRHDAGTYRMQRVGPPVEDPQF